MKPDQVWEGWTEDGHFQAGKFVLRIYPSVNITDRKTWTGSFDIDRITHAWLAYTEDAAKILVQTALVAEITRAAEACGLRVVEAGSHPAPEA